MKRLIGFVLLGLLVWMPVAQAVSVQEKVEGATGTFETTTVTTNTNSVGTLGPKSIIYGFKLIADDAGDACVLYDAATLPATGSTQGVFIDEAVEDTDNRTYDSDWPAPYILVTDLSVGTNGLACIIYHDVQ